LAPLVAFARAGPAEKLGGDVFNRFQSDAADNFQVHRIAFHTRRQGDKVCNQVHAPGSGQDCQSTASGHAVGEVFHNGSGRGMNCPQLADVDTRGMKIRSVHVDGPQPGKVATVTGIMEVRLRGQWLDCYVARFDNGELWFCPLMATKDFERVAP
jgi:hypothetical protein